MGKKNKKKGGSGQEPAQQQQPTTSKPQEQPPPAEPQPQASRGQTQKRAEQQAPTQPGQPAAAPPQQPAQAPAQQQHRPPPSFQGQPQGPPQQAWGQQRPGPPGSRDKPQGPPGFQPQPQQAAPSQIQQPQSGQGPPQGAQQQGPPPGGRGQQRPVSQGGRGRGRPQQPPQQQATLSQILEPQSGQGPPQQAWGQQRPGPPGGGGRPQGPLLGSGGQQQGPPGFQPQPQQAAPSQIQEPQSGQGPPQGAQQQGPPPGGRGQQRPGPQGGRGQQQGPPGFQPQPQQAAPPQIQQPQSGQGPPQGAQQQGPPQGARSQQRPGPQGGRGRGRPQQGAQVQQQPGQVRPETVPAKVDDVIITEGVKRMGLKVPPRRNLRGGGTLGRRTTIETNHLALDLSRIKTNRIVHYDVTIDPDKPKRFIRPVMEQFRAENYPDRYPAFDGKKNLYSSGYLPFQTDTSGTVNIQDEESKNPKEFKVTIKFANMVNLDDLKNYMQTGSSQDPPMEVIQAVDIVLREASASSKNFVQVGRSFFTPPSGQVYDLGEGLEMWYGFYQSAILGWRPFVNIDVAHKGFPKNQNVINLIGELFRCDPRSLQELKPYQVDDLNKYLRTLKVDYELPRQPNTKRCYRVNGVVKSPRILEFVLDNGQKITVYDYFRREKGINLQFPDFPCLHVGNPNRPNPIFVPVELCTVKSQQVIVRKMTENQTSNMIKVAATSADVRKKKIMDALGKAGFNRSMTVKEFGFSVSDQFEKVAARVLEPPPLAYFKEQMERPVKGVWRAKHFFTGSELKDWVILNLNGRYTQEDKLRSFCADMKKTGEGLGMRIEQARNPYTIDCHPRDIQRRLEEYLRSVVGIQLVVVVVPDRGDTYARVKQTAELNVGVLTQCVKARTMGRMNMSTIGNILLKVNSKLNGINHSLQNSARPPCLLRPVMIVGADVTHPSPDQNDIPSVAAVCASHDPKGFKYNIQYRLQGPREEIIKDLQNIMREHLMFFYKQTNVKPEKIIFYRDGVSEGQFAQVLNQELQAIRRACQSLSADYQPKITFLVVQKRHHTRFFPLKPEDKDGRNNNVPPGTVVDTEITHPTEMDFYLVSHASIQGTSRPTKYRRLWDDSDMSEDEVEQLTYYLCHMFSRCTRAVSYPTPTYYAHLAAYRARVYIEGQRIQLNNLSEEQKRRTIKEIIHKGSPMFFV